MSTVKKRYLVVEVTEGGAEFTHYDTAEALLERESVSWDCDRDGALARIEAMELGDEDSLNGCCELICVKAP
jgi:hypothetical protein